MVIIYTLIIALATFLFTAILHISKLQQQVNLLDKEQHQQNKEISGHELQPGGRWGLVDFTHNKGRHAERAKQHIHGVYS
jgi:hypothetical protein